MAPSLTEPLWLLRRVYTDESSINTMPGAPNVRNSAASWSSESAHQAMRNPRQTLCWQLLTIQSDLRHRAKEFGRGSAISESRKEAVRPV